MHCEIIFFSYFDGQQIHIDSVHFHCYFPVSLKRYTLTIFLVQLSFLKLMSQIHYFPLVFVSAVSILLFD